MFLRTLDARRQLDSLDPAARHAVMRGFVNWFGRLGLHFAKEEFAPQQTKKLVDCGLIGEDADKFVHNGQAFFFETVAKRCGLLMYSKLRDRYEIPKVPLVEYVIGQYLAEDAFRNPNSPQILIDTFRRWVWRPDRHDILDYAFDALWQGPEGKKSPWGTALLDWAKQVGRSDDAASHEAGHPVQDDWIHPFAVSVLRWRLLDNGAADESIHDDLKAFAVRFVD